jgi:Flp pilus assembly protein CpaB
MVAITLTTLALLSGCATGVAADGSTVPAIVLMRDLPAGEPITADDVGERALGPEVVTGDTVRTLADAVGRVPREPLLANEPLRAARLAPADAGVGVVALLEPGFLAVTHRFRDAEGWTVTLRPQDHVDLYWRTGQPSGDPGIRDAHRRVFTSSRVLADVRVLAVNDHLTVAPRRTNNARDRSWQHPYAEKADRRAGVLTFALTADDAAG